MKDVVVYTTINWDLQKEAEFLIKEAVATEGPNFGFTQGKRTEAGRVDWKRYYDASVVAGDKEYQAIAEAAKRTGAYISMGFSERDAV